MEESKKYILETSYNPEWLTFEFSLKKLLEISTSSKLCLKPPSKQPEWFRQAKKFQSFFNKNDTESFKAFFNEFYKSNREAFDNELYSSSLETEQIDNPETALTVSKDEDVVYTMNDSFFKETCPSLSIDDETVLPIKEIYRASVDFHKSCNPDSEDRVYPTLVLLYLYSCVYYSFSSTSSDEDVDEKEKLYKNLIDICMTAEDEAPGSGPAEVAGQLVTSNTPQIPSFIADMAKNFGFDMTGGNEAMRSMTGLVTKVMSEMGDLSSSGGKPDISQVLQKFSETLQKPDIKREFENVASSASTLVNANAETVKRFMP